MFIPEVDTKVQERPVSKAYAYGIATDLGERVAADPAVVELSQQRSLPSPLLRRQVLPSIPQSNVPREGVVHSPLAGVREHLWGVR